MRKEIKKILEKVVLELKKEKKWSAFVKAPADKPAFVKAPADKSTFSEAPADKPAFVKAPADKPGFDVSKIEVDYPKDETFGDYTSNIAMMLAHITKENPLSIAREIKEKFFSNLIEKIEVIAPGHINFFVNKKRLQDRVTEINKQKKKFGDSPMGKKRKVIIEFVSSNPTGPIHLGNGRGGPLGDTLASIMEKAGFKTRREFYVNDCGNQIEILGHSILKDEEAQYKGEYIDDLATKLDKNLKTPGEIGHWAAHMILAEHIKPTMKKLGINFDEWFSEESLHKSGKAEEVIKLLEKKDLVYEKDGALWYKSTKFGDDKDRVIRKSDGKVTYILVDFSYHKNKIDRGFDKIINIQGADHHKEAEVVRNFVKNILEKEAEVDHILTQMVRVIKDGQEVKMSKRKGVYFALDDLIEEVGKDAVRFIFLSYSSTNHINFDINLAKEQSEKNPVFYVQYAHARISSILKKAKNMNFKFDKNNSVYLLSHEKEISLIRELNRFPELVEEIAHNYQVHKLPLYAMKLADKFHSFYGACKVLDEKNSELTRARLNLVNAVKIVLAEALELMGIDAPEKM